MQQGVVAPGMEGGQRIWEQASLYVANRDGRNTGCTQGSRGHGGYARVVRCPAPVTDMVDMQMPRC